jgi:hypothetical protein
MWCTATKIESCITYTYSLPREVARLEIPESRYNQSEVKFERQYKGKVLYLQH